MDKILTPMSCHHSLFKWGTRTYVMGIVNASPDSFSGDGISTVEAALSQARHMVEDGADIIDVGGESTRPESEPLSVEQEMDRVIPLLNRLRHELNIPVSIDTYKYEVALEAVKAGADMLNDVWGLKKDARLAGLAAEFDLPLVITSNQRGRPAAGDIISEVVSDLKQSSGIARDSGVDRRNIIVDPGIGFGKTVVQNLTIIRRLGEMKVLGFPVLLGTSRKSFIGATLGLGVDERLEGTSATVALGIAGGADIVRVHDVKQMARVARMADAIVRGTLD
jgi:dihydropteroate synthase